MFAINSWLLPYDHLDIQDLNVVSSMLLLFISILP